jgi:selenide,water dikinase
MQERDLVLVGGGHTHALIIRQLAMKPIPGVRVTLISEQTLTPYSGMLPGYVAGHYSTEDTHIDLNRLCQWAGVDWIRARVTGIDPDARLIHLDNRHDFTYDKVSIDTGSTPDLSVPGAREFATGVKPVSGFTFLLSKLLRASDHNDAADWGVIGAGAGGVELVLALAYRLRDKANLKFHLIYSGSDMLRGYPASMVREVEAAMQRHGVTLHPNFRVAQVHADGVESTSGNRLTLSQSIWCTGAAPPNWLTDSALAKGGQGFIAVNQYLQSSSHADVFAAGDVADMDHDPRPKAGVYAVRQAPFLFQNLRRAFTGKSMRAVKLQTDFLSLVSLGDQRAVGCRFGFSAEGASVWRLKDHIDRKFMNRLNDPGPRPQMQTVDDMPMHCAGCGSKLGPDLVRDSLAQLPVFSNREVVPALDAAEDAALMTLPANRVAVQSIDGFRTFTRDLETYGEICVYHALSDIYAMGATAVAAQVWINIAYNHPRLIKRDYLRLMGGVATALQKEQVALAGGHSTEGMETHVGIVVTGYTQDQRLWRKNTPKAGDWLVLSKPLGTGVILAADMHLAAPALAVESAYTMMLQSNREIAETLTRLTPSAVTDVTGFGLVGHLLEMLAASKKGARVDIEQVPAIAGARSLLAAGHRSTLHPQLLANVTRCRVDESISAAQRDILFDPQTSGGLLIAIAPEQFESLREAHPQVVKIGVVTEQSNQLHIAHG